MLRRQRVQEFIKAGGPDATGRCLDACRAKGQPAQGRRCAEGSRGRESLT